MTAGPKVLDFSRFESVAVFFSVFFLISFLTRLIYERVVDVMEELGLITETTGNKKNRSFSYDRYIKRLSA